MSKPKLENTDCGEQIKIMYTKGGTTELNTEARKNGGKTQQKNGPAQQKLYKNWTIVSKANYMDQRGKGIKLKTIARFRCCNE